MSINEELSFTEYTLTEDTTDFIISFDRIGGSTDEVDILVNNTPIEDLVGYTVLQVNFSTWQVDPALPAGTVVRLARTTNLDKMVYVFTAGSKFIAKNVDDNFKQIQHSQQEIRDRQDKLEGDATALLLEINDVKIIAEQAASDANEALEKVDDILNTGVVPAGMILTNSGQNQQQVNDFGGAKWYAKVGGYDLGAEVRLADGSVVKSTIPNNTNNPNVAMTGWVKTNSASQVFSDDGKSIQYFIDSASGTQINIPDIFLNDTDNTPLFDSIIATAPNNAKIVFPYGKEIKGHFISLVKAFDIDLNGCTLINVQNNVPILQIGDFTVNEYAVTEAVLNHGATKFTVSGASTLFKVGDIGYLWDGATRPTSGNVNFESVKIKAITGDIITVENFLASYKGASAIKFYHSPAQLKDVKFVNGKFAPTPTHTAIVSLITSSENPQVDNIDAIGTSGPAVTIRYFYGGNFSNIRPVKAVNVGSGQGYGLQIFCGSNYSAWNINGSGMRHVYDQDSSYFFIAKNVSDDDDKSAPVGLSHNGFAGYGLLDGVRCVTSQYPVVLSDQGYGGSPAALKRNHPFRNIIVKNVDATIRASAPIASGCYGVYFKNNIVSCHVEGITTTHLNPDPVIETTAAVLVRIDGISTGGSTLKNLRANKIGKVFFASGGTRDTFPYDYSKLQITGVSVNDCAYVYHTQGLYYVDLDKLSVGNNVLSGLIGYTQAMGGDQPYGVIHSQDIDYRGTGVAQLNNAGTTILQGRLPPFDRGIGSSVAVIEGQTLTINEVQERSSWVKLNSPVGTGTINVNMPKPQTIADELFVTVLAGRYTVVLGGDNVNGSISVASNELVKLKTAGLKWTIFSRQSAI